jgi:hypothetical protein
MLDLWQGALCEELSLEIEVCNVPDLASLGNVANVCVGSKVYNI